MIGAVKTMRRDTTLSPGRFQNRTTPRSVGPGLAPAKADPRVGPTSSCFTVISVHVAVGRPAAIGAVAKPLFLDSLLPLGRKGSAFSKQYRGTAARSHARSLRRVKGQPRTTGLGANRRGHVQRLEWPLPGPDYRGIPPTPPKYASNEANKCFRINRPVQENEKNEAKRNQPANSPQNEPGRRRAARGL